MEYVLRNTDIFDEQIGALFNQEIRANLGCFGAGRLYKLVVSFNVDLLHDKRFESFNILPNKTSKGELKDKIYDVLDHQLHVLEQTLANNGIEIQSATIQGEELQEENMIKIELTEDNSPPYYRGRGKEKKLFKVFSIVPSRPYISDIASEEAGKALGEIYRDLKNLVRDNKLMSAILEIDETEDEEVLIKAFLEQYRDLWFPTKKRKEELLNRLHERIIKVCVPNNV